MLKLRESDIPALFVFLVVLPVAIYILLGKWSEASKRKHRISFLAQLATEEARKADVMDDVSIVPVESCLPVVSTLKSASQVCAQCFRPAKTRCSQCKSVKYCSGKCQIIHWRKGHKEECHRPESFNFEIMHEDLNAQAFGHIKMKQPINPFVIDTCQISMTDRRPLVKWDSQKSKESYMGNNDPTTSKGYSYKSDLNAYAPNHRRSKSGIPSSSHLGKMGRSFYEADACFTLEGHNVHIEESTTHDGKKNDTAFSNFPSEIKLDNRNVISKYESHSNEAKSSKLTRMMKTPRKQLCPGIEGKSQMEEHTIVRNSSNSPTHRSNGVTSMGIMKMMGLRKSKKQKIKMIFPYKEFVKVFHSEICDLSPRGLSNCGNSCYANAVLQCLAFTKPLVIYLLQRSHSISCCVRNWCLMCELEQHVLMLRKNEEPMSLSRILSHMRTTTYQIGDGSQEDAHEFLRLLVTSMQSICLEGLGGEREVDPRLQETTFIQHTFGGRLRSKVKCLRCLHDSERYENIMDLTLEILGWVESLEDALTQFTTPEDLDGENMYRCGRCASYVRAHKQLSIYEAPNILTIVLKRFQEGRYGKINKCITFPESLNMIPFMTRIDNNPELYVLYGVVVHLDTTMNASFSGHYVAYVKDLQGNWFKIDDAEVQPVPISQVMSEEAYILFYMRSCPRPMENCGEFHTQQPIQNKNTKHQNANINMVQNMETRVEFSDASSDWSIFTSSDNASFTTDSTRDSFSNSSDPMLSIFNTLKAPKNSQGSVLCRMFSNTKAGTINVCPSKFSYKDTCIGFCSNLS